MKVSSMKKFFDETMSHLMEADCCPCVLERTGRVVITRRTYRVRLNALKGDDSRSTVWIAVSKQTGADDLRRAFITSSVSGNVNAWLRDTGIDNGSRAVIYGRYWDDSVGRGFMPVISKEQANAVLIFRCFCENEGTEPGWINSDLGATYWNKSFDDDGESGMEAWIMKYDPKRDAVVPRETVM